MKLYAFKLPDEYDGKDLTSYVINLKMQNDKEGVLILSHIDEFGRFRSDSVVVKDVSAAIH